MVITALEPDEQLLLYCWFALHGLRLMADCIASMPTGHKDHPCVVNRAQRPQWQYQAH